MLRGVHVTNLQGMAWFDSRDPSLARLMLGEPGAVAGLTGRATSPLSGPCGQGVLLVRAHWRAPPLPRACRVHCDCVVVHDVCVLVCECV